MNKKILKTVGVILGLLVYSVVLFALFRYLLVNGANDACLAMLIFLPHNLDIEKLLKEHSPGFKYDIDNFKYILDLISRRQAMNPDFDNRNNGFVNINMRILQKKIHNYKPYIEYLLKQNIIVCDNYYENGKKSKGYKFSDKYQTVVKVDKILKWSLVKQHRQEVLQPETHCKYLDKWLTGGLEIDFYLAKEAAEKRLQSDIQQFDAKAIGRYNVTIINIYKIFRGEIFYKRDKTVYRYHSSLTNIPKDMRNFIKYKGRSLVAVDVKSCQPYEACRLFDKDFYRLDLDGKKISLSVLPEDLKNKFGVDLAAAESYFSSENTNTTEYNCKYTNTNTLTNTIIQYLMIVKSSASPASQDFYKFSALIREGELYEYILSKAPKHLGLRNRGDAKEAMFYMMFSKNETIYHYNGGFKLFFADLFPDVYNVFEMIKQKDYTLLSGVLQTMESEIIINRACKRISKERPRLFIATVHDSIVTTVGDEYYVESVLNDELTKAIGFEPILKFEYWKPENSIFYETDTSLNGIDFSEPDYS